MKKMISAIACMLALVLCLTACGQSAAAPTGGVSLADGGVLVLSVNPEIAVEYDENGTVTGVTARNDDALAIIASCEGLIGQPTRNVVTDLVTAIGDAGYFVEEVEGEGRQITLEIEPGSSLPNETFLDDVIADIRNCVSANDWTTPLVVEGESDYGMSDYVDTDYGVGNDGFTDYDDTDYGPDNDGVTDYDHNINDDTDYGEGNDGVTDYDGTDYADNTDYGVNADGNTDYNDSDYGVWGDGLTDYDHNDDDSTDYGEGSDGVTDYDGTDYADNTDYGVNADGVTDYTDYGATGSGSTGNTNYGDSAYGDSGYEAPAATNPHASSGNTDYGDSSYDDGSSNYDDGDSNYDDGDSEYDD
ncbi:MAG: hypothetical protein IJZ39_09005 [Oscillospiraceae bacterium]|nr:hypothetical protein [Oscillospiraceae bacterium]